MAKAQFIETRDQAISKRLDDSKPAESMHMVVFTGETARAIGQIREVTGMEPHDIIAYALGAYHREVCGGS